MKRLKRYTESTLILPYKEAYKAASSLYSGSKREALRHAGTAAMSIPGMFTFGQANIIPGLRGTVGSLNKMALQRSKLDDWKTFMKNEVPQFPASHEHFRETARAFDKIASTESAESINTAIKELRRELGALKNSAIRKFESFASQNRLRFKSNAFQTKVKQELKKARSMKPKNVTRALERLKFEFERLPDVQVPWNRQLRHKRNAMVSSAQSVGSAITERARKIKSLIPVKRKNTEQWGNLMFNRANTNKARLNTTRAGMPRTPNKKSMPQSGLWFNQ